MPCTKPAGRTKANYLSCSSAQPPFTLALPVNELLVFIWVLYLCCPKFRTCPANTANSPSSPSRSMMSENPRGSKAPSARSICARISSAMTCTPLNSSRSLHGEQKTACFSFRPHPTSPPSLPPLSAPPKCPCAQPERAARSGPAPGSPHS